MNQTKRLVGIKEGYDEHSEFILFGNLSFVRFSPLFNSG